MLLHPKKSRRRAAARALTPVPAATGRTTAPSEASSVRLLPLGALAAGFGLLGAPAFAQQAPAAPAAAASAPAAPAAETTMRPISVKSKVETDANSVRATTTTIGKGTQELRDIPQSLTVVTEKLMEDRRIDTVKQALHQTAGVTFLAAEGGEEDIRLRGFSLAASGDIYVDSLRDPAFYDRDVFNYDRVELLRGSASMLFGRGSTGGVVNQVTKLPFLANASEINATVGNASFVRFTGDFNAKLSDSAAVRVNVMETDAGGHGGNDKLDKQGIAPTIRWGINTDDEFHLAGYYLRNNNGINYGLPYIRNNAASGASSTILSGVDPDAYYGAPSDYSAGEAAHLTGGWTHRFANGGQLKSAIRHGRYDRDQRASTVRFCQRTTSTNNGVTTVNNPDCPTTLPGLDTLTDAQPLVRGTNNKVQNMSTTYAQSDYSQTLTLFGRKNDILTGIDLAHEVFENYSLVVPTGVTLNKNVAPRPTIGTPNNGIGGVDEGARLKRQSAGFDAKAAGLYLQDLVEIVPTVKLLGGIRWDYFKGGYQTYQTAANATAPVGTQTADRSRTDRLWSKRFGILWQPTDTVTAYASYGTSFNTSGDTYQYDDLTKNTPPEGSVNYEVGVKGELFSGDLSGRVAAFKSVKTNERNRDSDTASPTNYLLSGQRHAAGMEVDLAGRILPGWEVYLSYAWIPSAKIDAGAADGTTLGGERVGDRPSLTPRHSGTIWTTYQLLPSVRIGGGLNARASQTPNRNPAGIVAPRWVTGDLLAEYTVNESIGFRLNVLNVTNKHYADSLYSGHYIPGVGRQVQATMTARF